MQPSVIRFGHVEIGEWIDESIRRPRMVASIVDRVHASRLGSFQLASFITQSEWARVWLRSATVLLPPKQLDWATAAGHIS